MKLHSKVRHFTPRYDTLPQSTTFYPNLQHITHRYQTLCIVIALLIFSRAEGPRKYQQGNKILIPPLNYCAKNLSPISTFSDGYFRR